MGAFAEAVIKHFGSGGWKKWGIQFHFMVS